MSQISDTSASGPPPVGQNGTRVYLVAALARNGVIGAQGKMPWHLPEDLRHFKKLTLGRKPGFEAPGASVAASIEGAIALCAGEPVVFVIGGAEIYAASMTLADGLVLTEIDQDYEGDTRFPEWDRKAWRVSQKETHTSAGGVRFSFLLYEKA
jgi:dihydrofolate reductase